MPSTVRPSRRWYRFRLRTLMILLTVAAAVCGYAAKLQRDASAQRAFVTQIKQWGGFVNYDFEGVTPGEEFSGISIEEYPWYKLRYPHYFGHVDGVFLHQTGAISLGR